jgi:hypothetical protein
LARLFLLPILRLRLGFAIYFSTNIQNLFIAKTFNLLQYMILSMSMEVKKNKKTRSTSLMFKHPIKVRDPAVFSANLGGVKK